MPDNETTDRLLEVRTLWSVASRLDPGAPWGSFNTERSDAAAVLREYDYALEKHPEMDHEIRRTVVTVSVEDVEALREIVEKASAAKEDTALQSE